MIIIIIKQVGCSPVVKERQSNLQIPGSSFGCKCINHHVDWYDRNSQSWSIILLSCRTRLNCALRRGYIRIYLNVYIYIIHGGTRRNINCLIVFVWKTGQRREIYKPVDSNQRVCRRVFSRYNHQESLLFVEEA